MRCGLTLREARGYSLAQLKMLDGAARRVEARRAMLEVQVVNAGFSGNAEVVRRLREMGEE